MIEQVKKISNERQLVSELVEERLFTKWLDINCDCEVENMEILDFFFHQTYFLDQQKNAIS